MVVSVVLYAKLCEKLTLNLLSFFPGVLARVTTTSWGIRRLIFSSCFRWRITASWQFIKKASLSGSRLTANCTHSSVEKGFLPGKANLAICWPPPCPFRKDNCRVSLRVEEMSWRMGEDAEERERRVALVPGAWSAAKYSPMLPWTLECNRREYSGGRVKFGALGRILYAAGPDGDSSRNTPLIRSDMFKGARRSSTGVETKQSF